MADLAPVPKEPRKTRPSATETSVPGLDGVDRRILDELQAEGRVKLGELGRRVRLSPAAVAERVRRLEERGVITGYAARVSPARLGYGIQAFVRVDPHAGLQPAASPRAGVD